jgi:hypothetical protein
VCPKTETKSRIIVGKYKIVLVKLIKVVNRVSSFQCQSNKTDLFIAIDKNQEDKQSDQHVIL